MTVMHDGDHLTAEIRRSSLGIMTLGNDPIEELAAGAELHDEVDRVAVLVGALELDDVAVTGQMMHDLHLAPDVLHVIVVDELPSGDGFAGELLLGLFVSHEVGDAELTAAELAAEGVGGPDVLHGLPEDPAGAGGGGGWRCLWFGRGGSGRGGIWREHLNEAVGGAVGPGIGMGFAGGAAAAAHFESVKEGSWDRERPKDW